MKARVKATGKIVEIIKIEDNLFIDNHCCQYELYEIEWEINDNDYWIRLEHQYAGMAMQAYIIASHISQFSFCKCDKDMRDCKNMAHALVEKMKEEK